MGRDGAAAGGQCEGTVAVETPAPGIRETQKMLQKIIKH